MRIQTSQAKLEKMNIEDVFYKSIYLDMFVIEPLWIARGKWDLRWNSEAKIYIVEEDSFGQEINDLISEINGTIPSKNITIMKKLQLNM